MVTRVGRTSAVDASANQSIVCEVLELIHDGVAELNIIPLMLDNALSRVLTRSC
jgi:hypothetical protein